MSFIRRLFGSPKTKPSTGASTGASAGANNWDNNGTNTTYIPPPFPLRRRPIVPAYVNKDDTKNNLNDKYKIYSETQRDLQLAKEYLKYNPKDANALEKYSTALERFQVAHREFLYPRGGRRKTRTHRRHRRRTHKHTRKN